MTSPITGYMEATLELAHYYKLEDGSFASGILRFKVSSLTIGGVRAYFRLI